MEKALRLKKVAVHFLRKVSLRLGCAPWAYNSTSAFRKVFARVHAAGKRWK